ncbi:phytanoyl-CoA dioxygenase [Pisolithus tinctorius]|nr:phytanoyl-CoA dioxygenase [Pisolithus tinctorius]
MAQQTLEYLSQDQVDLFYRDGYIKIPGFLSKDEVDSLLARSKQLLDQFDPESHPLTKFTTSDHDHVGDEYFLESGDKIRYFLEEDAVGADGRLTRDKTKTINKIGHGLHLLDSVFRKVTLENEKLRSVVKDLRFHHDPVALQSMVIFKQPEIGGAVPEHNDSTFLYTSPPTALGFWIPLERCTPSNGALSFLPGSHLTTPIAKRFVRLARGGTGFESVLSPDSSKPDVQEAAKQSLSIGQTVSERNYILEVCEPGDLVLIHGSVLHKSERNTSSRTRYAYTFHMIDSPPYAKYDEKNWLQPTQSTPFPKVLDAPLKDTISATAF